MQQHLINEMMGCRCSNQTPEIGMTATQFVGSDRYAYVVTEVISSKKIKVARMDDDDYKLLNENDPLQILDVTLMMKYVKRTEDKCHWEGSGKIYTLRKNGRWMPEGMGLWETCSIHLGHADNYMDPCF
jgi:hypothetical protein